MEQQAPSSPQGNLPLGVDPEELYDGPVPARPVQQAPPQQTPRVVQHPRATDPRSLMAPIPPQVRQEMRQETRQPAHLTSSVDAEAEILSTALHMVSARVLGVLSLLASCAIWGYAVFDPTTPRTTAATLWSVTIQLPVILLYWREYWKSK